ncbi:putative selenate ABC transporter substrate-binding protein [Niallia endozanthoxylica]|uniref:Putative selenate ABC transporter substrate-binding protein n=1 Tax=Niallia endozanthoxylica TaxID=2036016 RepID=A0A5J5HT21_9BACI|nr:putative selenate ABC transporter substrate-binding protein [Niallia endozanthoxylica]KAA9025689.1 putative selenate ABC transporter substrate-binding protein [Niallia endozanthoxylica]
MKNLFTAGITLLLLLLLTACSAKEEAEQNDAAAEPGTEKTEEVFKIGAIPDQNAADMNRSLSKLADYLSEKTDLKVEYVPSVDYAALVTAFERGEIQLAWFGGLTGVQARNVVPDAEAIAQRPMDEEFHSVFIAGTNTNIKSLEDLKGQSFTFGSESSTSGHLMPRYFLEEAGIDPEKDFDGQPNYSGSHDKTYKLVESGSMKAGVLNISVWEAAVAEKKVDTNKVDVFYTTPSYYDYHWTINLVDEKFGEGTKQKVTDALLSINSTDQPEIMELFQSDKFIPTKNDNYKAIEQVAKEVGIIK